MLDRHPGIDQGLWDVAVGGQVEGLKQLTMSLPLKSN